MANESRGLGRGLQALLAGRGHSHSGNLTSLPLTVIRPGAAQPRHSIDAQPLAELAASIKANGVIQPIVVRPIRPDEIATVGSGAGYEIVAGERRWQASKLAGLTSIPVVIRELSDRDAIAVALIENIQREELTPAEEARALNRLIAEFALTHQQVAEAVGRSRASVTNIIRLLDLPAGVVALMDARKLTMGHARALLALEADEDRDRIAAAVVERGLSVRETERLVRRASRGEPVASARPPALVLVTDVPTPAGMRAQLHQRAEGGGRVVVEFSDVASRDALLQALTRLRKPND